MKQEKQMLYRVYNQKDEYHQSYSEKEDAISCAKHIFGKVKIVEDDGENQIFNCAKKK